MSAKTSERSYMSLSRRGVLTGAAALALAGCGQPLTQPSSSKPETQNPGQVVAQSPTPTQTPSPEPVVDTTPRWPLTGVPLKEGQEKKAAHPPVAVKVPVERRSFPQYGVDKADLVIWEGQGNSYDITRLCAIFHSTWPKDGVQPVRSTRPVDVPLLAPLGAVVLACTGAVPWVLRYVKKYPKIIELREKYGDRSDRWTMRSPGGWWRGGNLDDKRVVAIPKNLSAKSKLGQGIIPPVYLPYASTAEEVSTVNGTPVNRVTLTIKGNGTEYHRYEWSEKKGNWPTSIRFTGESKWLKYTVRGGAQVAPDNVLIVFCQWKMGVRPKYHGHKEPLYSIENGSDKFIYIHDGKYVTGTWTKGAARDPFVFKLDDGTPLKMAPGKTWMELPQHNAKVELKA